MRKIALLIAFGSQVILHAQGMLKLSGGGVSDWTEGRAGLETKTYRFCAQPDSCPSSKWVGFFGSNLLPELKNDSDAYAQGRRFRTVSMVKAGFFAAVPISLFSGALDAMKGKETVVIGLTLASLAGAVTSHILENKQFYRIGEVYNRNRVKVGFDSGNGFDHVGLVCRIRL